jgi:hypothetical protein
MASTTLLAINGVSLAAYAARGLTQTLTIIEPAKAVRRTINGNLRSVSPQLFRKFASTVSCKDQAAPAWLWPGLVVWVDCAVELNYQPGGSPVRTPVNNSMRVASDGFTFYRPRIQMMVLDLSVDADEWGGETGWSLSLEEV